MQLRRIISGHGIWIPQVDGLRFIAIMTVLMGHAYDELTSGGYNGVAPVNHWWWMINKASNGVPLFFAISGFLLSRPFVRSYQDGGKPVSLKAYFMRRLTRLEPPYILSLLLYFFLLSFASRHGQEPLGRSLLFSMFYLHNFSKTPALNIVNWSLEVEVQFYILAPLLATVFAIKNIPVRRTVLVLAIVGAALLPTTWSNGVGFYLVGELCFFLVGYLLADLRVYERVKPGYLWDIIGLISFQQLFFTPDNSFSLIESVKYASLMKCALLFLFFTSAICGVTIKKILGMRFIALIGGMCYSIYLIHLLVYAGVFRLSSRFVAHQGILRDYLVQAVILIPTAIGAGALYYIVIERPCMDPQWPQKLGVKLGLRRGKQMAPSQ